MTTPLNIWNDVSHHKSPLSYTAAEAHLKLRAHARVLQRSLVVGARITRGVSASLRPLSAQ
ncbi:MAG: hypothetical protein D6691_07535 [Candidatus Hydrogenedentota bacterium]|uniref:Uncharacterized protein n=1 Tax=Sumerlaea chitinivorans TaxID=2250252 RepID=A0A2Z4Y7L7_SUMC1|nr:hypothetical protein BRCON_2061 [Candidatus Sumerlaea chitinivorans]RMH26751.1 MAG: hypothetical protein D6691_07535 [Candidatus Hydrogenedentota bacterium]